MTESDLNSDQPQAATEAKRPWGTPRIILAELARRARVASPTSTPCADSHGGATTLNGS